MGWSTLLFGISGGLKDIGSHTGKANIFTKGGIGELASGLSNDAKAIGALATRLRTKYQGWRGGQLPKAPEVNPSAGVYEYDPIANSGMVGTPISPPELGANTGIVSSSNVTLQQPLLTGQSASNARFLFNRSQIDINTVTVDELLEMGKNSSTVAPNKVVPNPGGRLGNAATRAKASEVVDDLVSRGFTQIRTEVQFRPGSLGSGGH